MEGYIKEIKELGNVTILTIHIGAPNKPWEPLREDCSTDEQFEELGGRYLTEYAKYESTTKSISRLHLGLVDVKQED